MLRRPYLLACAPSAAVCLALWAVPTAAAPPPAEAPATQDSAADEQKALQLFEESETAYRQGRFGDAAALLEGAYALHAEPTLLYNLARARESQGELALAADAYERYLNEAPNAADRGAIEQRVRTLRERDTKQKALEAERKAAEERLAALEQAGRDNEKKKEQESTDGSVLAGPLPWIVFGLGIAGVGAGVVVGLLAESRHQDAVDEPTQAEAQRLQDGAEGLALGSTVAYVAGGTLAAAGTVMGIVGLVGATDDATEPASAPEGSGASARAQQTVVRVHLGPGTVTVAGRF